MKINYLNINFLTAEYSKPILSKFNEVQDPGVLNCSTADGVIQNTIESVPRDDIQQQINATTETMFYNSKEFPKLAHDFFLDNELKKEKREMFKNFTNEKLQNFPEKNKNDSFFLFNLFKKHLINYPTPINLNYLWGFGSLIGIFLVIQIVTGIFLAMHYTPHIELAFASVEHIMRDVNYGWLIRYAHANGASFIFITLYLHIFRNLYYSSYIYPYTLLWKSGMLLFILMMATAFMGYVLPFGQMSFWGATVIINLFSAIPIVGKSLVYWLLGGFSVENATLNRFFSLHYFLPFVITGLTLLHLTLLHVRGSSNPLGISEQDDKISFYPYFYFKDLVGFFAIMTIYFFMVFFYPNVLGHSDNYIEANALVTPTHIVPEWYFLPFYAISRSIPSKLGGVICMGLSLIIFFFLPYFINIVDWINIDKKSSLLNLYDFNAQIINISYFAKGPEFRFLYTYICWVFAFDFLYLMYYGAHPVEVPYIYLSQFFTLLYFLLIIFGIPLSFYLEKKFYYHIYERENNAMYIYYFYRAEELFDIPNNMQPSSESKSIFTKIRSWLVLKKLIK